MQLHILLSNEPLKIFVHELFLKTEDNAKSRFLKWIKLWMIINKALVSALGLKVRLNLVVFEDFAVCRE